MKRKYKIIPDMVQQNQVLINWDTLKQHNMQYIQKSCVRFGAKCREITLKGTKEIGPDELIISNNIIESLRIPIVTMFEIAYLDNQIVLGPYIGILAAGTNETLEETVSVLSNYLYDYDEIGGAIVAFSTEGVNVNEHLIEGYVYNPIIKKWEHGVFVYPSSIFRRKGMSEWLRNHFQSIIGNKIFNNYMFNKWEMHSWLHQFPEMRQYLPETILYTNPSDFNWFLEDYKKAYIKPIYGSQGLGIVEAVRNEEATVFRYEKNGLLEEVVCKCMDDVTQFSNSILKKKQYLIQTGIDIYKVENKIIDFRLLLAKDYSGEWKESGLVAKFGEVGGIVSNVSRGGRAVVAEEAFERVFKLTKEEGIQLKNKMIQVGILAAKNMEKCGVNLGNLGIDIALDWNLHIWIIEINNKDPNHTIAIDAGDRQSFYRIKKMNMLYAKRLAGF